MPFPQALSVSLCAQLCNEKAGNGSPGVKNNLHIIWTERADLGLGTLRGGREGIRWAIWEVPGEEMLKHLELVQPGCVLEVWLDEGWNRLPFSPSGNGRYAYPGGLVCLCTAPGNWASVDLWGSHFPFPHGEAFVSILRVQLSPERHGYLSEHQAGE